MAQTEVKKFLEETQRQIDEEGLLSMSGSDFKNGDSPSRVLKAKQFEARIYSGGMVDMINPDGTQNYRVRTGKFVSKALIAMELNAMYAAIKNGDFEELIFDDSTKYKDDIETYMEDDELEVTKGCGGCCDYDVCWPDQEAVDRSVRAQKVMNRIFAQGARRDYADAQMKKYFYQDYAVKRVQDNVERILQLEREGKTKEWHDY